MGGSGIGGLSREGGIRNVAVCITLAVLCGVWGDTAEG
jgi:hypothetical protein